ncbi:hypothetical protein [Azospirillum halopraeferens]|uniref:hypothetical protein n=1 Tax=Azospirillum halopraeferens TaxID=34010 RepID=UPI0003FFD46A|nr:hypothetical protein [Azospirillum halopraeferens]
MIKGFAAVLLGLMLFATAACENMNTQQRRALYGGGIGAAGGALIGGATGGNVGTGALIGGAAGAATGALTRPGTVPGENLFD